MGENKQLTIELPAMITVRELAEAIQVSPIEIIKILMNNGVMANINQPIDFDTAAIVASERGYDAVPITPELSQEEDDHDQPMSLISFPSPIAASPWRIFLLVLLPFSASGNQR